MESENNLQRGSGRTRMSDDRSSAGKTQISQVANLRQVVNKVSQVASQAWRFLRGDAVKRPFVEAPLQIGDADATGNLEDTYPLSPLQNSMLIQSLQVQRFGIDIEQIIFEMHEDLNVPVFRRAWQRAIERHPILRTVFQWEGAEGPRQEVHRHVTIPWTEADWRGLSARERDTRFESWLLSDRLRVFDLTVEPGIRLALFQDEACLFRLVWTFHHIAMDGRGIVALLSEVFDSYEALCRGVAPAAEPAIPYRAFIAWQHQQEWSRAEAYWRTVLKGFHTPTPLVVSRMPPCELEAAQMRGEQEIKLSAKTTATLKTWAKDNQLTLNTLVQGAWALLLSRYSGEQDVVFGTIRACRHGTVPSADRIVGLCINTVPMRVRIPAGTMLLPWLKELRNQWVALREYEHTPLIMVHGWGEAPRGTALFQTIVNFQDPSWDAALLAQGGNWNKRVLSIVSQPNVPIVLDGYGGAQIKLILLYDRRHFDDAAIARMLGHLQTLLEGMAANPNQCVSTLPLLMAEERQQLVVEWNKTKTDYPKHQTVHRLFEAQAKSRPKAIALVCEGKTLSYQELNRQANQLAHFLRDHGVTNGTMVGICVERSLEMIVGLLGILKAGGAYVPLDPAYPQERLAFMLSDSQTPVLLTQDRLRGNLPKTSAKIICLDSDWAVIAQQRDTNFDGEGNADELAYVIYTSGSTGKPKGACVPHRGVVRLVKSTNYVRLGPHEVFLQFAPISFDASTFEIWGCLLNGGRLVIFPPFRPSLEQLGRIIQQSRVTTLWLTAALFQHMVDNCCDLLKGVRQLLAGGDVLPVAAVCKVLQELKGTRLINGYGPTENTTFTCCHRITDLSPAATSIPIGRPIANTTVYVLDRNHQPVPIGVPGELWTGGDGLAQGYLNQPDLTAERFIADPFSDEPGARLYRSGDLVRYLPDGSLEFLGRIDQQVKIRGFRIELGEIETVLAQHPAVREAVVAKREDTPGDCRLVAYVVLQPDAGGTIDRPRQFLKEKLPDYMIPSAVVVMKALPLSPNGKVDRRALPKPERSENAAGSDIVKPRSVTEEVVVGIWEDVLKIERVGIHDNFFEVGGDSLLATLAVVRLGKAFQVDLPVSLLFSKPTLADLSERIDQLRSSKRGVQRPPVMRARRDQPLPLSFFQERIWEYCQATSDPLQFSTHMNIDLRGPLDAALLQRSLTEVVRRHEVLRTTVGIHQGKPVQIIRAAEPVPLLIVDLSDDPDAAVLSCEEDRQPFDLVEGPLMRAQLLRLGDDRHRFTLGLHHLIYDGSVREIFFHELGVLYGAFGRGEPSPLPEPALQYADFAVWQRQCLEQGAETYQKQLDFWKQELEDSAGPLRLPFERAKPAVQDLTDAMQVFPWFPEGLCRRLGTLSHREGCTLFMTLLAGFKALLFQYTGQEDVLIGTYVASHSQPELESVIGLKTNLVALRTNLSGNPTFRELLHRVRETTLEAYAHQDLLFHQLSQALQSEGRQLPNVQAIFQHVRISKAPLSFPGVTVEFLEPTAKTMPWGFSLNFMQCGDDHVVGGLSFDTDRYDPEAVRRMIPTYLALLERVAGNPDLRLADLRPMDVKKAA
jgi:amino acid adenylation domain-containing protein